MALRPCTCVVDLHGGKTEQFCRENTHVYMPYTAALLANVFDGYGRFFLWVHIVLPTTSGGICHFLQLVSSSNVNHDTAGIERNIRIMNVWTKISAFAVSMVLAVASPCSSRIRTMPGHTSEIFMQTATSSVAASGDETFRYTFKIARDLAEDCHICETPQ